jgi:hypothetical protein
MRIFWRLYDFAGQINKEYSERGFQLQHHTFIGDPLKQIEQCPKIHLTKSLTNIEI